MKRRWRRERRRRRSRAGRKCLVPVVHLYWVLKIMDHYTSHYTTICSTKVWKTKTDPPPLCICRRDDGHDGVDADLPAPVPQRQEEPRQEDDPPATPDRDKHLEEAEPDLDKRQLSHSVVVDMSSVQSCLELSTISGSLNLNKNGCCVSNRILPSVLFFLVHDALDVKCANVDRVVLSPNKQCCRTFTRKDVHIPTSSVVLSSVDSLQSTAGTLKTPDQRRRRRLKRRNLPAP